MKNSEEKQIVYEDAVIHYSIVGNGQPVMLLHGFAEDRSIWADQIAFLQDRYKLLVPDMPGTGKSTLLKKEVVSIDDYASCIKSILKKEEIEKCILIGHSMGGYITLAFAEIYPEYVTAFGLFHSSAYADDAEKVASRQKAIEFIGKNGASAFLATSIPGLFKDAEKSSKDIKNLLENGNNFSAEALIQYYEAMITRPDRTNVLKNSKVPVLFVLGEYDKAVPFKAGLEQSTLATTTYVNILRRSAHMGMLEETEKSNRILADFLQFQEVK